MKKVLVLGCTGSIGSNAILNAENMQKTVQIHTVILEDVNLKNTTAIPFRKKIELDKIKGRGGTSFQPAFDYYNQHTDEYSGMIIFTDGEGAIPATGGAVNILWILDSRLAWEKCRQWINTIPGNQSTYLPF